MKDRHLNPKAACLKKREEEKAALRIGSCSTPGGPLTPTGDQGPPSACFTFEELTGGDPLSLSLPPTSSHQPPNCSSLNPSVGSISPGYYTNAGESAFHSTSPVGSYQYSIPCNPSPPPLTPTEKIPRIKSEPHMKKKANGSLSPTLRKACGAGRILSPVMGTSCNNSSRAD